MKKHLSPQQKSKWLLNSSRLILGLIILSLPTQGFSMEDSPTKKRLQAKLRAKRGEVPLASLARNMGPLDRATKLLHQEEETEGRIADRIDADVLSLVQKRKISVSERENINVELSQRSLDLSQVKSVKEGFLKSVESELNFVRTASKNLDSERDFWLERNPGFNKEGAFASDLLHPNHPLRKKFILSVQPLAKGGIRPMEEFHGKFSSEDPTSYKCIMRMYLGLCALAEVNWEGSKMALGGVDIILQQASISRKAKNLLSTIYDAGILRALDAADVLQPYATSIAQALELPGMLQVTEHARQVREFVVARQRETRPGPSISPVLLGLLRERMALRDQELISPPKEIPMTSRALPLQPTLEQEPAIIMPTTHNLKGEHREPSAEEVRREKKKEAKQRKKEAAALRAENDKIQNPRSEIRVIGEKISQEEREKEIVPLQIGGNFKTFEKLMNQTYKGPIEKVVLLFQRLGGNVEEWHSGSRIKFSLPHFANLQTELLDILPPQTEDEDEATSKPVGMSREEAVFHGPHKQKSKKLRPYHVNDIREMLIRAGYNEKTVVKRIQ